MLRQHHLRIPDVKAYLRVFDKAKPTSPNDWAAQESQLYEPGYLIFCLEQVAAPSGLSTFSKKAEDQGETFRVKDLCVVVSKDEGQCVVVNISASAYEFRVLDTLLQEKATRAILDGKDFNYLACRPVNRLVAAQIKSLYKVGSNYAQGGSRRSLTVEGSTMEEPLLALLGEMGAKVTTQVGKPLLDIGAVCHMIFTPEGRQDDKNKSLLKACFVPIKEEELALGELAVQHGLMTEQAIRAEQAITPTASAFEQGFTTPLASQSQQSEPIYEPVYQPIAPPATPSAQPSFDISPALQQVSYSNLQLPPQSEINAPTFGQSSLAPESQEYAFEPTAANSSFVPSAPAPAPELPSEPTQTTSRYDDTPPWATASADALTAVLIAGDNRIDQQLTTVKMAPPWYAMSHDAYDAPAKSAVAVVESSLSKEDFSAQFFNDYQQGFAGEAAIAHAEGEFEREKAIKEEFERGKQTRLKNYLGDNHYDQYVKGGTTPPPAKTDSWDLNPATYTTPVEEVKNAGFDSPIFENAARGTIETNPEAKLPDPVPEEPAPANPDAWMDYQPPGDGAPVEATPATADAASSPTDVAAVENPLAQTADAHPSSEAEWSSAVESSFNTAEPLDSSLFERLTQQLSKDSGLDAAPPVVPHEEDNAAAAEVWQQGTPVEDSTTPMTNSGGGFWSNMDPNKSLLNAPEGEVQTAAQAEVPLELVVEPVVEPELAKLPDLNVAPPAVESVANVAPLDTVPTSRTSQVAPDNTPAAPEMSDSQVMQTRVRPRDYSSPLRRSSELGGSPSSSDNISIPAASLSTPTPSPTPSPLAATPAAEVPQEAAEAPSEIAALWPEDDSRIPPQADTSALWPEDVPLTVAEPETTAPVPAFEAPTFEAAQTSSYSDLSVVAPHQANSIPEPMIATPDANFMPPSQQEALSDVAVPKTVSAVSPSETKASISDAEPIATIESIASTAADFATSSSSNLSALASDPSPAPAPAPSQELPTPAADPAAIPAVAASTSSTAASAPAMGEFDSGVRKTPPAQDTRLMMNEMATLMSKLEQQVAKAANKMSSRAEELKVRLNRQVESLLREAQDLEKHAEVNLTNLSSELRGRLDNLAVDVQSSLSKESEGGRSLLSDLDASGLETLEAEQRQLSGKIIRDCAEFKSELEKLTMGVQTRLNNLIASRNDELARLSESILEQLKESHDAYGDKVTQRFDRFRERMLEENSSITQSLERNMRSMVEEIDSSLDRACEKLRSTKLDLEQTISHTMAVSEMAVAQKTKQLLAETLLPRLNEQKEILRTMIHDMSRQVASESNAGLISELARLDGSINRSSESLKRSVEECLADLESSGGGLKSGLEETFKRASQDLVQRTQEVAGHIRETERRMLESDLTLKNLAEASTVDSEPELTEERNHALSKLGSLKQQANKDLAKAIESSIETMENESEKLFAELTNKRADFTSTVRDSSEWNLDRVRQALTAATSAIQSAREKHME